MIIRKEIASDIEAITEVTIVALFYLAASAAQLLYSASILSMRNYLIPQRRRGAKKKE